MTQTQIDNITNRINEIKRGLTAQNAYARINQAVGMFRAVCAMNDNSDAMGELMETAHNAIEYIAQEYPNLAH
jgi:hypothetical protein